LLFPLAAPKNAAGKGAGYPPAGMHESKLSLLHPDDSMRVLIDGANRGLAQGTGISTYARTLAAGLADLGHDILWLSGAHVSGKPDPLADAAQAADDPPAGRGLRGYLETAANMSAGLLRASITARRLQASGAVAPRAGDLPQQATLLAPDLFVHAHYRHMLLRKFCEVRTDERVDVLHLTAPLPIRMKGVKTVVTIHDLVPIRLPYTTSDNKREFIDRVRTLATQADLIVTVSEASKREIVDLLQVDAARIAVTWQPSDIAPLAEGERESLPRTLARFGLEPDRYGLFVGAIEPKKNVRRLVDAFLDAHDTMPLVLVGPRAWKWQDEIGDVDQRLGEAARKRIRILGHVPREDLRRLFAGARMLAFPSLHEGFGLPVLEAMRMGCPVLTSHAGGLAEVAGDAAVIVDPLDPASIRAGITRLLADDALRASLREAGRTQAQKFSAEAYRERLAEAYARLA
jgi:glycosyltransferase involved in cell wall biosynthesis